VGYLDVGSRHDLCTRAPGPPAAHGFEPSIDHRLDFYTQWPRSKRTLRCSLPHRTGPEGTLRVVTSCVAPGLRRELNLL